MNINYEIQDNKNITLAMAFDKEKATAKEKLINVFGPEGKQYSFELRVTQRGIVNATYFYYIETESKPAVPGVSYIDINKVVKATVVDGNMDELMSGSATASFQLFMKDNKIVWDVSKAFLLMEEPISDQIVFYLPLR